MRIKLFGKYYGWCPIYRVDIHLKTGTVMSHRFYKWRQKDGGFKWATPDSLNFKSVDSIEGWQVVDAKYRLFFGVDASLWHWED